MILTQTAHFRTLLAACIATISLLSACSLGAQPEALGRINDLGLLTRVAEDGTTTGLSAEDCPTVCVFWTPLCEPSRRAVMALPALAEAPEARGWRFLAITFHGPADITPTFDELGVKETDKVALCHDDHGAAFRAAGLVGTPVAAIFDADGSLRATTHPSRITPAALKAIAAGKDAELPSSDMVADRVAPDAWDLRAIDAEGGEPPTVKIETVEDAGALSTFSAETGVIAVPGAPASSLLAAALDIPRGRLILDAVGESGDRLYRVKIVPSDGSLSTARRQLAEAIRAETGWTWRTTSEAEEAWVIEIAETGGPAASAATEPSVQWMGPCFNGTATIADVARWFESITGTPAVDATGLAETLIDVDLEIRSRSDIDRAFESVGLRIDRREVPIERVRVVPRGE